MVMGAATGVSGKRGKGTVVDLLMLALILAFTLVLTAELIRVLMLILLLMLPLSSFERLLPHKFKYKYFFSFTNF